MKSKSFSVENCTGEMSDKWDSFIDESLNGTIFNKIDFLNYHGDKFKGKENHLVFYKGESIVAVFSFLIEKIDGKQIVKSPYGGSFGGMVLKRDLSFEAVIELVGLLLDYLSGMKVDEIVIVPVPDYCYKKYDCYFDYALGHYGFKLEERDAMGVVQFQNTIEEAWDSFQGRSRTSIRKAQKEFVIKHDCKIEEFYPILMEDKIRHNVFSPTHTLENLMYLKSKYPKDVWVDIAIHQNGAKAGNCYFRCNSNTVMTFYLSQENSALHLNGTSVLIYEGMKKCISDGIKYFDFGQMTARFQIQHLGVANFKESFGARGYFRNFYTWKKQ